jgi:hypothetical protein
MRAFLLVVLGLALISPLARAQAKKDAEVTLSGTLRGDRIAIGGESTGWSLTYKDKDGEHAVEIVLPPALATRPRTPTVVKVTGSFGTREYVERGTVRVFRVTKIEQPPAK